MRVVYIGTGAIGLPVLRSLLASSEHQLVGVVTQPDKPVGRAQRIGAETGTLPQHEIPTGGIVTVLTQYLKDVGGPMFRGRRLSKWVKSIASRPI